MSATVIPIRSQLEIPTRRLHRAITATRAAEADAIHQALRWGAVAGFVWGCMVMYSASELWSVVARLGGWR